MSLLVIPLTQTCSNPLFKKQISLPLHNLWPLFCYRHGYVTRDYIHIPLLFNQRNGSRIRRCTLSLHILSTYGSKKSSGKGFIKTLSFFFIKITIRIMIIILSYDDEDEKPISLIKRIYQAYHLTSSIKCIEWSSRSNVFDSVEPKGSLPSFDLIALNKSRVKCNAMLYLEAKDTPKEESNGWRSTWTEQTMFTRKWQLFSMHFFSQTSLEINVVSST